MLDIVALLTDQHDYNKTRNYWKYLKASLKKENSEVVSATTQLKLIAPDGKKMNVEPAILPNIPCGYQNRLGFISGRFTSTDALFEKYPGWSPYQYSMKKQGAL